MHRVLITPCCGRVVESFEARHAVIATVNRECACGKAYKVDVQPGHDEWWPKERK